LADALSSFEQETNPLCPRGIGDFRPRVLRSWHAGCSICWRQDLPNPLYEDNQLRNPAILLMLAVGWLSACQPEPPAPRIAAQPAVLPAAPDMAMQLLDDASVRLSDYEGQVVVVNFWGTWCPPCRMEIPHFVDLYEAYAAQNVAVIGVALNESGPESVRAFRDRHGITYPIALGSATDLNRLWSSVQGITTYRGTSGEALLEAGVIREIPTTFIINPAGQVVEKHVGYRERRHLEPVILRLLEERTASEKYGGGRRG